VPHTLFKVRSCYCHCSTRVFKLASFSSESTTLSPLMQKSNAKNYPTSKISGLSYFAIQIQFWFFKTQSKSNRSPKISFNCTVKTKSKWNPKKLKNAAFSQQKCCISFPFTGSKSWLDTKFWSDLQSGCNANKFAIVWSSPMLISALYVCSGSLLVRYLPRPTA